MPESIMQWSQEFLPSVLLNLTLWTLGGGAVGFLAGVILFFFLRLIRLYRMKFTLGGLLAFLFFLYTVIVTTVAFGALGFFESIRRQTEHVLDSPENQQMVGEFAATLSSRSAALAYAYGIEAQETGNSDPNLQSLLMKMNSFDKGEWGIDLNRADGAFDQITDEVLQKNYENLYGMVFKDVGGNQDDSREQLKSILDRFVDPEKLSSERLIRPLRATLTDLETRRQTTGTSGPVYASELKAHAGARTSEFMSGKLGGLIFTQQVFIGIIAAVALAIPMVLALLIQIFVMTSKKKTPAPSAS